MSATTRGELIWRDLERQLQEAETAVEAPKEGMGESGREAREGVWASLKETANVSNYRPAQAQGVVYRRLESQREGAHYMLNNPQAGTYLKLDERDFYIWSLMDGTRSIKQLVVAYFSEFGSIAFGRITDLVTQLRAARFLADPPVDVYAEVHRQCSKGTPGYWAEAVWRTFLQKEMAFNGTDAILTAMYRYGVWVFFSRPALLLYPVVAIVGLALFIYTVQAGTYPLFHTGGKWYWGVLTFIVANIITVAVHESAHAFTAKHFGRRVRRGGLLIYFGSPAFFVDTMDIWMEPKKARIAVSAAGPYSGLLLGSLCMFIIAGTGFSDAALNSLIFKVAIWAFVFGALTNLNPLLEWDGYFILMDWLEIPMLRKRSLDFVKRNLLNKIITRASFSREERVFAVFGVLALVYTVVMIVVGLFFWQSRVSSVLEYAGGWVFWLLIGLIAVVVGIPLALVIVVMGYRAAKRARLWAYQRLFMGRPGNQMMAMIIAAAVVAIPALFLGARASGLYAAVAGSLTIAFGLLSSVLAVSWYSGSRLGWFFLALPWLVGLLLVAQALGPFDGPVSTPARALGASAKIALLLALAFHYPTLLSFTRTVLQGGWAFLAVGCGLLAVEAIVTLLTPESEAGYLHVLALLGYGAIGAGLFRLHHMLRSLRLERPGGVGAEALSDAERLSAAVRFLVEGALEQFSQIHGRRALRALEEQFNASPGTRSGWGFSIRNGRVADASQGSLMGRSQAYVAALSHLSFVLSRAAGRRFLEKQAQGLYRLMPWEEREVGDEYLFSHLDWMAGVRRAFATSRSGHLTLLRSAPLFAGLGDEELRAVSDHLRQETHPKGRDIIRQGDPGSEFYIIESGTVEVWVRHEDGSETLEAELGRGDYFGERALLADAPRAATCRCKTRVRVLSLDREVFDDLVARRFRVAADLDEAVERAGLLAGMPLFSEVSASQVKLIASKLVAGSYPAGTTIIRQGDIGDKFYVVKSGIVEVRRRVEGTGEETTVGRLGQGEYFGEIALLMNVPRTASVVAATQVELLSLDAASFDEMVKDYLQSSHGLEQVSTRRMTQLRRAETLGYRAAP